MGRGDLWLARRLGSIEKRLSAGASLADSLQAEHLIGTSEAEELRATTDLAGSLENMAARRIEPRFLGLFRHLPVMILTLMTLPTFLLACVMRFSRRLGTDSPESIFSLPGDVVGVDYVAQQVQAITVVFGSLLASLLLVELAGWIWPAFNRNIFGWYNDLDEHRSLLRLLRFVRYHPSRLQPQVWERDWTRWWSICRRRLPRSERNLIASLPDLRLRLHRAGILRNADDSGDMGDAERDCAERLESSGQMLLRGGTILLIFSCLYGVICAMFCLFDPVLDSHSFMHQPTQAEAYQHWMKEAGLNLFMVLSVTGGLYSIRLALFQDRRGFRGPHLRLLAHAMIDHLRERTSNCSALLSLAIHQRSSRSPRLMKAIDLCRQQPERSVIDVLMSTHLLSPPLARLALGAEAMGPSALEGYFTSLLRPSLFQDRLYRRFIPLGLTLVLGGLVAAFHSLFTVPKLISILKDLSQPVGRSLRIWTYLGSHILDCAAITLILFLVTSYLAEQLLLRHRLKDLRATLLVLGTESQIPIDQLAKALSISVPVPTFEQLCRACGWTASTPNELSNALDQTRLRRDRRLIWLANLTEALSPIVVGAVVLALILAIYHPLIDILYSIKPDTL